VTIEVIFDLVVKLALLFKLAYCHYQWITYLLSKQFKNCPLRIWSKWGTGHCCVGSPVQRVQKITVNCVEQQVWNTGHTTRDTSILEQ